MGARAAVRLHQIIVVLGLALGFLLGPGARAETCVPAPGQFRYALFNDARPVGRLEIDIAAEGRRTTIRTGVDIRVDLIGLIPVLVYRHASEEVWVDGTFQGFSGVTVDNGRRYVVGVEPSEEGLRVVENGAAREVEAVLLSWTVWCEQALAGERILNPLKGRLWRIATRYLGEERLALGGTPLTARRYAVAREGREGSVWYGANGTVLKAVFPTKRGTRATLVLE